MAEWNKLQANGTIPPDQSLILVAVMPSPRDLEIARVLGWYRIPFRFAPKIVYVDYLAFYFPSVFGGEHSNRIESIAEVRGVELTTRREIIRDEPDHPRADEEYYKIQIGQIQPLKEPIAAGKWKRITFLYTTGERIKSAKIINDLVVQSEERKILWRSLRERQEKFQAQEHISVNTIDLDENVLMMLGELSRIRETPGWYNDI